MLVGSPLYLSGFIGLYMPLYVAILFFVINNNIFIFIKQEKMAAPNFPSKPQRGFDSMSFPEILLRVKDSFIHQLPLWITTLIFKH
jgi:hypothetical protein